MTIPTAEDWRALARSAPWLWQSVEFELSWSNWSMVATLDTPLHAWLRRPGDVRVGMPEGEIAIERRGWLGPQPPDRPHTRRPDGLVLTRTFATDGDDHGLYFHNYYWLALLDPQELADGVNYAGDVPITLPGTDVRDVMVTERFGRTTWWATVAPTEHYYPRCSCCAMLPGPIANRLEYGGAGPPAYLGDRTYPAQWLVGLDLETGLPVSLSPAPGEAAGDSHSMRIRAVDEPMADSLFT